MAQISDGESGSSVRTKLNNFLTDFTGLVTPSSARTNLGSSTVGDNIFTLTNPSAVRFLRVNADNTVTALTSQQTIDAVSQMTTLGDTTYGGASGTQTRLAGNTSDWRKKLTQTGSGGNSAAPVWVNDSRSIYISTGDQTTTSASATNITDLVISVEANSRYLISGTIRVGCSSTGGVKIAADIPTSASVFITATSRGGSGTAFVLSNIAADTTLSSAFSTTGTSSAGITIMGEVSTGANSGSIQFMFASGVGGETSTVYQLGSFIRVEKI